MNIRQNKPTGLLQVDVDGLWAVRRCYGVSEKDTFKNDPCWTEGVIGLKDLFLQAGLPASFFIVGRDLTLDTKRREARKLIYHKFELANHSWSHHIGLTGKPYGYILNEIRKAHQKIETLGYAPVGFRSPGYDIDARILRAVRQVGYRYDASILPTYWGPAFRLIDGWMSRSYDLKKRQFGRVSYARAPRQPYFPRKHKIRKPADFFEDAGILEIPVGVIPHIRLPLTGAVLLSRDRNSLRNLFQKMARRNRPVTILFHAIDAVDCRNPVVFDNRTSSLGGFNLSAKRKLKKIKQIIEEFSAAFDVKLTRDFAEDFIQRSL